MLIRCRKCSWLTTDFSRADVCDCGLTTLILGHEGRLVAVYGEADIECFNDEDEKIADAATTGKMVTISYIYGAEEMRVKCKECLETMSVTPYGQQYCICREVKWQFGPDKKLSWIAGNYEVVEYGGEIPSPTEELAAKNNGVDKTTADQYDSEAEYYESLYGGWGGERGVQSHPYVSSVGYGHPAGEQCKAPNFGADV